MAVTEKITPRTFVPIGLVFAAIVATASALRFIEAPQGEMANRIVRVESDLRVVNAELARLKADMLRLETDSMSRRQKEDERWEHVVRELSTINTKLERK